MTPGAQTDIVAVYAVFGSEEEARRIARSVVEERLAACANILGACHSVYRWQGVVEEATEVATIFKTGLGTADALVAAIRAAHSYDVPAVVVLPISGTHPAYLQWVAENSG